MQLEEVIGLFETCKTIDDLCSNLQRVIENYGFSGFSFVDAGHPNLDLPYFLSTLAKGWQDEYIQNKFVLVDPCIARARRTNTPFTWGSLSLPSYRGRGKPGSVKLMEAARDNGFNEGFVIPYHVVDPHGRIYSSSTAFFWKDPIKKFTFLLSTKKHELHLIMIYWAQRAIDIIAEQHRNGSPIFKLDPDLQLGAPQLTDRERDVLSWAARGKTVTDTSDILTISNETVETHMRNAMRKLGATNKTHAVAKAIYLNLIDV